MNFGINSILGNQCIPDEITEEHKIMILEQMDRQRFIEDVKDLMNQFVCFGVSKDMAAYLAAMFYNDPAIKSRRRKRREKENGNKQKR